MRIPFSKACPTCARARAPPRGQGFALSTNRKPKIENERSYIMTKSKDVTPVGNAPLPAHLLGLDPQTLDGETASDTPSLAAQVLMLQGLSPQVSKHEAAYIEGAEPGDIVVPTLGKVYKGDE